MIEALFIEKVPKARQLEVLKKQLEKEPLIASNTFYFKVSLVYNEKF
jgi:hypothetical protein